MFNKFNKYNTLLRDKYLNDNLHETLEKGRLYKGNYEI